MPGIDDSICTYGTSYSIYNGSLGQFVKKQTQLTPARFFGQTKTSMGPTKTRPIERTKAADLFIYVFRLKGWNGMEYVLTAFCPFVLERPRGQRAYMQFIFLCGTPHSHKMCSFFGSLLRRYRRSCLRASSRPGGRYMVWNKTKNAFDFQDEFVIHKKEWNKAKKSLREMGLICFHNQAGD